MSDYPKVFISILNWNGLADTRECLESVYKMDYPNYEVIVVDNASYDDSVYVIKDRYPKAILIESKENLGFTGGNNIAMHYAMERGADYIWLLNNDTIVEVNTLSSLVEHSAKEHKIGLVSPTVRHYNNPEMTQFKGILVNWKMLDLELARNTDNSDTVSQSAQARQDIFLWGTALLIKRAVVEKIGYLDEKYFAYWEDIDYSLRSIKAGFRNVVYECANIYHKGIRSSDQLNSPHYYYYMIRNEYHLKSRYLRIIDSFNFKRKYLGLILYYLSYFDTKHANSGMQENAMMRGAWHAIKGIGGPMVYKPEMPRLLYIVLRLLAKNPPYFWSYFVNGEFVEIFKKGITKMGWRRI